MQRRFSNKHGEEHPDKLSDSAIHRIKGGKQFVSTDVSNRHKALESRTRKFIVANIEKLRMGAQLVDAATGIRIQKSATGKHKGKHNYLTLKVSLGPTMMLFVKIASRQVIQQNINGLKLANKWMEENRHTIGQYNVRAIMPLRAVVYKNIAYLSTQFFEGTNVKMVSDIEQPIKMQEAISQLKEGLSKYGVTDVAPENIFYSERMNTLFLFDLNAR